MSDNPRTAVAYYRVSTFLRDKSIEDQRTNVMKFAKRHGYAILREYKDEGISGDDTINRTDFLRMIADAQKGGFTTILCWDQDRFGRFDSIEAGRWIYPLREAGVKLATVAQGEISWDSFAGRMIYSIMQESKHQYLRDKSRDISRGQLAGAKRGDWMGGPPPYAFHRMIFDQQGRPQQRLKTGQTCIKPSKWRTKIVVSDDEREVEAVRWIFDQVVNTSITIAAIAKLLNERGIPAPRRTLKGIGRWTKCSVWRVLKNRAYRGDTEYGKVGTGKYHRLVDGEIVAVSRPGKSYNAEGTAVIVENTHESIVDPDTWDRAQSVLSQQCPGKLRHLGRVYLLRGLLICRNCKRQMSSACRNGEKRYICSSKAGKPNSACRRQWLSEDVLVAFLEKRLRHEILAPNLVERLKALIQRRIVAERSGNRVQVEHLRGHLETQDQRIEAASRRLTNLPDDLAELLIPKVQQMVCQRARTAALIIELQPIELSKQALRLRAEEIAGELQSLYGQLTSSDLIEKQAAFQRLISKVECWFSCVPGPRRKRIELLRGKVTLRPYSGDGFGTSRTWTWLGTQNIGFTAEDLKISH